jgi:hypothetical protein
MLAWPTKLKRPPSRHNLHAHIRLRMRTDATRPFFRQAYISINIFYDFPMGCLLPRSACDTGDTEHSNRERFRDPFFATIHLSNEWIEYPLTWTLERTDRVLHIPSTVILIMYFLVALGRVELVEFATVHVQTA